MRTSRKEKLANQERVNKELAYMDKVVAFETGKENLERSLYNLVEVYKATEDASLIPAIQYIQNCLYSYMHK